jgi:hypothetical protein
MLEGEKGPQKKEFEKLVYHLGHMPRPDVVTLPSSLLIAMARPVREAVGADTWRRSIRSICELPKRR